MLGLRLDEPLPLEAVATSLDPGALARLERLGLARRVLGEGEAPAGADAGAVTLTTRGRLLGDGVTADLLA